eukprot:TRINITY_DN29123_c0_g1_i1.p1 TRINITY_DN29123_c0_g1~~TRINITY_DN29123_c0_g1_i1.p1  ORF type:complete len:3087 (-),score=783.11 TRINITY_DN29123_c0_g1_i1:152-8311(-)
MDTPSSPTSPESSGSWKPVTKSIPLESETKYIPLERSKKLSTEEENRRSDFPKPISISSPKADRPKLSETESKNKLLKLKQKLEGKSGRELSPNLFISSNTKEVSESPQEPDSQRSEERSEAKQVTPRKSRPSWTSPTALDSPPSLSIAESPVSPDTQTASPEQMASPDTQTASPDGGLSPAPSQIPDTPASPDGHSSPEAALVIQDTPSSPDNSPSHENSFVFGKPLKEIPTVPITADSTRNEQDAQPIQVPVPSETKKKIDPRRRDPRNRNKEPPKIIPPKKSPYDPTYIPNVEVPSSSSASPNMENTTPAYMSNLVSNLPPPMWKHQQQQHRFENPLTMPHLRQSSSFQQMPPHQLQHRLPPPGMPFPMQGPRMPNRNQGPMMIDPHFQQPQQPKNYREYRKIKEEEDKKRKEFEEKKRNEEKSRKEAEIKNKQAISDPMVEDKDSSEDKEDEKHLNKKINDKIKESKDPRKKKLWNCEKSDKKETEKSDKKETEREDKKPTETIKSFKIPKMKKPDSEKKVEGNNDVKNIIKEVDIFKPLSKKESSDHKKRTKSEEKKDTTITASKSPRKMEKYITKSKENVKEKDSRKTDENSSGKRKSRAVKGKIDYSKMDISDSNDEDSDPIERDDIEETVEKRTPEPVENTSTENTLRDSISYPDSDSDSEPGLTIAEDTEEKKVSRSSESESENKKSSSPRKDLKKNKSKEKSESVAMDNKDTNLQNLLTLDDEIENSEPSFFKNKPSEEPSNTEKFSKNDLTKELLKNIVSTLDPKEAKKMLEKASAMSKEEKMSISKLKTLITADSDESEDEDMPIAKKRGRGRPKTPVKANPKKTKKKVVKKSPKISPTSKGTRRSRRLVQEDESEIEDRTIEEDQDTVMENETEEDKKTIEVSDEKISANDSIGLEDKTPTVEKFEEQKTESAEIMEPVDQEPTAGEPSKRQEDHVEEAQFETFVIEPKAVQKRGRKKRCKKPESYSELDEDLQDAFISSSNIIEQNQELKESKLEIKDESDPALKQSQATIDPKETTESDSNELREDLTIETVETVKPKLEVEDKADRRPSCEAQSPPPLGMRQTRSMRTRMAPKSKTWFPGDRGTAAKKSVFSGVVSPPIKQETVIKKENVEVDTKVFLGEGEVAGEIFKDNKFEFNEGKMEKEVITSLKTRHSTISSIFDKLVKKNQHQALSERASKADQVEIKQKSKEEPIKLCSKIKLSKPVVDLFGKPLDPPSLKPEIEMKPPDQIIASTTNLVQKLASQVKPNNLDNIELDHSDPPSLIDIIQGIKKRKERRKLPPPPLIPLNKNDEGPKSLDLVATELGHFTRKTCSSSSDLSKYKSSETLSEMFSPEILKNLFKCMGSMCAFSSDSPQSFSSHLHSHGLDSTNLLRCCYCFRKARSVEKLVTHIIKKHGSNKFQCIHCFYSSKSQMDLILHQNTFHKSFPKGFIACGHLASDSRNTTKIVATQTMKCPALNCHFESVSSDLKLIEEHLNFHTNVEEMIGYFCPYCEYSSDSHVKILLHQSIEHQGAVSRISIRQIEIRKPVLAENSSSDESEGESEAESDLSDFDKHFYDDDIESLDYLEKPETITEPENEVMAEAGLSEHNLYRCANQDCLFAAATSADFKDHLLSCDFASPTLPFTCFHCSKEHKHIPTLMEHMKTHSLKRMSCSLCDFKDSVMSSLKVHAKSMHKISNFKFVPVDSHKNNPEEDYFVLVPKNAIPKGPRSKYVKDTFSPTEIETIPIKPEIYKFLIRCSICDFASRVKNNLVKHLKLHLKEDKLIEIGALEESNLPTVTPVNPPPIEESETSAYSRMKSLLPEDLEEDLYRQPISEIDLAQMPVLIPENLRYACSGKDCRYITIDEVMLLYHIKALHGEMKRYKCPHCPNTTLAFDELPLHMKCHGELLFKCGYCTYYHWQKRIADKHVAEHHQGRKQFVKNVREDEESRKQVGREDSSKKTKKKDADPTKVSSYEPYKCGLCDLSSETVEAIRTHCREVHEMTKQFKCGMCNLMSDKKQEIEKHFSVKHSSVSFCMLKIFYVDPSTSNEYSTEEKSKPLWAREMEGIKHIRGILYDDFEIEKEQRKVPKLNISKKIRKAEKKEDLSVKPLSEPEKTEVVKVDPSPTLTKSKASKTELDYYPMKCKECDFPKKTVTGLKMHIKLNHLQLGKFQCQHCVFTANLKVSIQGHYRNKHTDTVLKEDGQDKFDYIERSSDAQAFTQEYWKEIWGVPTMDERKALLEQGNGALLDTSLDEESDMKRKRDGDAVKAKEPKKKRGTPGPKRGRKRKLNISVDDANPGTSHPTSDDFDANILKAEKALEALETAVPTIPVLMPIENSPFESHKTYMCVYCPRRSQNLERIQRHHGKHHSTHPFEFQELTRDQVVNLITSDQSHGTTDSDFKCFYCQHIGGITKLKEHNESAHVSQVFRVVKFQGKGITGYLECQICGYLSPGFEKYFQKAHFHEEHPLENDVNCSKYISKSKVGPDAFTSSQQAFKFDVNEVIGMTFECPKHVAPRESCTFKTQTLAQMNSHLRKHTKTYKCGHCGKTHLDNSEFHRHSALSHGDKIPDLVKDPEAEAEYEALKGLLEDDILKQLKDTKASETESEAQTGKKARLVARKSTNAAAQTKVGDKCRNVSRKSTGPGAKYWPETRIEIPYSFYKIPAETFDAKQIKTRMAMGGVEITLDAEKMGELIKLDPKLVVEDCKSEIPQTDSVESDENVM